MKKIKNIVFIVGLVLSLTFPYVKINAAEEYELDKKIPSKFAMYYRKAKFNPTIKVLKKKNDTSGQKYYGYCIQKDYGTILKKAGYKRREAIGTKGYSAEEIKEIKNAFQYTYPYMNKNTVISTFNTWCKTKNSTCNKNKIYNYWDKSTIKNKETSIMITATQKFIWDREKNTSHKFYSDNPKYVNTLMQYYIKYLNYYGKNGEYKNPTIKLKYTQNSVDEGEKTTTAVYKIKNNSKEMAILSNFKYELKKCQMKTGGKWKNIPLNKCSVKVISESSQTIEISVPSKKPGVTVRVIVDATAKQKAESATGPYVYYKQKVQNLIGIGSHGSKEVEKSIEFIHTFEEECINFCADVTSDDNYNSCNSKCELEDYKQKLDEIKKQLYSECVAENSAGPAATRAAADAAVDANTELTDEEKSTQKAANAAAYASAIYAACGNSNGDKFEKEAKEKVCSLKDDAICGPSEHACGSGSDADDEKYETTCTNGFELCGTCDEKDNGQKYRDWWREQYSYQEEKIKAKYSSDIAKQKEKIAELQEIMCNEEFKPSRCEYKSRIDKIYYRTIDVADVFPNRKPISISPWQLASDLSAVATGETDLDGNEYSQSVDNPNKPDSILKKSGNKYQINGGNEYLENPQYTVTLTPNDMAKIRKSNSAINNNYAATEDLKTFKERTGVSVTKGGK